LKRIDYEKLYDMEVEARRGERLLLHCCCAPCATSVIERLKGNFDITLYYFNPNIMPKAEHDLRLENLKKLADHHGLPLIAEPYDVAGYLSVIRGTENQPEGKERCDRCIAFRIDRAYDYAISHGFTLFTTTLSASSRKNAEKINAYGESVGGKYWLHGDFKKRDAYLITANKCAELGIYRQEYCGCKL